MPDALRYMPRHLEDSSGMTDRDLARDTRTRVGASANSFDLFTIALTGSVFNGEERVVDKSGGLIGRLTTRVQVLEAGYKSTWRVLLGMGLLMLAMTGIEKSSNIVEILDKLKVFFN